MKGIDLCQQPHRIGREIQALDETPALVDTLTAALGDSADGPVGQSLGPTPMETARWKSVIFQAANFVIICYMAIRN